jgi:capsular exopolysaccharide synthesis family protein
MKMVAEQLNVTESPESLGAEVSASSPLNTVLLNVSVTDKSAGRAQSIANSVARQFPALVDEIETPKPGGVSPVHVSATRLASLPGAPSAPNRKVDVAFGLLGGLVAGVGGALLRSRLDKRIRDKADAERAGGVPVLGGLANDGHLRENELVIAGRSPGRGEEIRQLRTNIRFLSVDRRLSSFVITSSVAGEGKTIVGANLALAMAQAGEKVVFVDGDLRRPRVGDVFGLPGNVGLTSVLLGELPLNRALHQWRGDLPLYVLPAGAIPPNPSELLASDQFGELVDSLVKADFRVIFDSSPLLPVTDASLIAQATGGAVVVTHVGRTRTDQLAASVDILKAAGASVLGIVANRLSRGEKAYYYRPSDRRRGSRRKNRRSSSGGLQMAPHAGDNTFTMVRK